MIANKQSGQKSKTLVEVKKRVNHKLDNGKKHLQLCFKHTSLYSCATLNVCICTKSNMILFEINADIYHGFRKSNKQHNSF